MGLSESFSVPQAPPEWQRRHILNGDEGTITTGLIEPVSADEELLRKFGYDPEEVEIVGNIRQWRKEQPNGQWLVSYNFGHRPKQDRLDLPALYAATRPSKSKIVRTSDELRVTVVPLADVQAGKTGSRGGTPELIERLAQKRYALSESLKKRKPTSTVLMDVGDSIENFQNTGSQLFTNDLSLTQQMDLVATELYEFIKVLAPYGHVDVMGIPSNHGAWRNGKQELGRPGDDFGIFIHTQVQKVVEAAGMDVTFHRPAMHDESLTLEVLGTNLGLTHGHQFAPGSAPLWWAKQTHGGQPVGAADILVTGHYHCLNVQPTGRNPYTGKAKYWLQAPTLDNGSDWYRNKAGEDSDPGLLVFDVTESGFDLQSLTVL